jgi:HEAT repeat protein
VLAAGVEPDADLSAAALASLATIPGADADRTVAAALDNAAGQQRAVVIDLIGRRRIVAAVPTLLKAADDSEPSIRAAAIRALGETIAPKDLSVLTARVLNPKTPEDAAAAKDALNAAAIRGVDREQSAQHLVAALPQASLETKTFLMELLGTLGGPTALEALAARARDKDEAVQDAATRILGEWMTPDAGPVLLDLAKTLDSGKFRIRAMRGYIRIPRQLDLPNEERLEMCEKAFAAAERVDEKKLVLEVLNRNPSAQSLSLAMAQLGDATLRRDAANTAVAIAEKLAGSDRAIVADAMQKIMDSGVGAGIVGRAKAVLEKTRQ